MHEIKDNCMHWDTSFFSTTKPRRYSGSRVNVGKNPEVEQFLFKIKNTWKEKINLYNHNCQHFSHFVKKLAAKDFAVY
jgi:hypothetical protein